MQSEASFQKSLAKLTKEAKTAVQSCVSQFLTNKANKRQVSANAAYDAVDRLYLILHDADRPQWLVQLRESLSAVKRGPDTPDGLQHIQKVATALLPELEHHVWTGKQSGFDFDGLFEKYRDECRIPELFDEIIEQLKKILEAGDDFSRRALRELETLIATLQSARDGSYFATRNAWNFAVEWFKNTAWEAASSIPGVSIIVKGLRKTLEDGNKRMSLLHEKIYVEVEEKIAADFPRIEYHPLGLPAPDEDDAGEEQGAND